MMRWMSALLACLVASCPGIACAAPQARQWLGEFTLQGKSTTLILHGPAPADAARTEGSGPSVDLPGFGARSVPVKAFARDAASLRFLADHLHIPLRLKDDDSVVIPLP